jgi:hypothetical protein
MTQHLLHALLYLGMLRACHAGGALVGPGALSPYSGGGGSRGGGWGYVDRYPMGFFVGGSSIEGLNGLYFREEINPHLPHAVHYYYTNKYSGWMMLYVNAKDTGHEPVGGRTKDSEWVFVDTTWRDRFAHEGQTYLPGAGRKWSPVHRERHFPDRKSPGFVVGDQVTSYPSQQVLGSPNQKSIPTSLSSSLLITSDKYMNRPI